MQRLVRFNSSNQVLEFGCNDGVFLDSLSKHQQIYSVGVDPSDVAKKFVKYLVFTDFFNQKSAEEIIKKEGYFDLAQAAVFAHIDDVDNGQSLALKDDGALVVEVHYLRFIRGFQ